MSAKKIKKEISKKEVIVKPTLTFRELMKKALNTPLPKKLSNKKKRTTPKK